MATQFAIGLCPEVLLVQHARALEGDITKMFLVHVDDFQPSSQKVILADGKFGPG